MFESEMIEIFVLFVIVLKGHHTRMCGFIHFGVMSPLNVILILLDIYVQFIQLGEKF